MVLSITHCITITITKRQLCRCSIPSGTVSIIGELSLHDKFVKQCSLFSSSITIIIQATQNHVLLSAVSPIVLCQQVSCGVSLAYLPIGPVAAMPEDADTKALRGADTKAWGGKPRRVFECKVTGCSFITMSRMALQVSAE